MAENASSSVVIVPPPSYSGQVLSLNHSGDGEREQMLNEIVRDLAPTIREYYYGRGSNPDPDEDSTDLVVDFIYDLSRPGGDLRSSLEEHALSRIDGEGAPEINRMALEAKGAEKVIIMERMLKRAFRTYKNQFPLSIWDCCKRCCFAKLAADPDGIFIFDEVINIHEVAESLLKEIGDVASLVPTRRRGIGVSRIGFVPPQRAEREFETGTDRQKTIRQLARFVADVLPFLYGVQDSRNGTNRPARKLCSEAICCLLGVSRNFLYARKKSGQQALAGEEDVVTSLIDNAGVRMRQHRRVGLRTGYPEVNDIPSLPCSCPEPCFGATHLLRLHRWYNEFKVLAKKLKPRQKENQYLLDIMYCPLMNTTVGYCNRALSNLFTVSEAVIVDIRRVVQMLCDDPTLETREVLETRAPGYQYTHRHPMNRYPDQVRDRIETYLDMTLRADPGASGGINVCRVYSPEINTQEKLRRVLAKHLQEDDIIDHPMSASTLQRMINNYLSARKCEISFNQSDHNACPTCKTLGYAILQYNHETKLFCAKKENLEVGARPFLKDHQEFISAAEVEVNEKSYQESCALETLREHTTRDGKIRGFLKRLTDHFRAVERNYTQMGNEAPCGWNERHDHAIITHQDDMTKVDLPSFIVTASADITRWRYDVNAHVNAVTNESIVFSHEQGGGAKTGSSIMELILLDHVMRCRGEGIKVIVSDNAAVGKNWLTTVALPQYMVDQGLASVVMVVFLENNHGKWLADMLFGQLQTRRKRSTVLGIDSLLHEFESVNRRGGSIDGFAVNSLSCIAFSDVLSRLGYETKPPQEFCFLKRNIHFATACAPRVLQRLPSETQRLIGKLLPRDEGMVRVCTDPPNCYRQEELPFESRFIDVPAASLSAMNSISHLAEGIPNDTTEAPLVVPMDQEFAVSGPGVVSRRNMLHVGYNGFEFRKVKAYPELRRTTDQLVKEAWPAGLLNPFGVVQHESNDEPVSGSESVKCAPENWVLRRPVGHFRGPGGEIVARYPPRNMLNAKHKKGPRESSPWEPTATYQEPPVPTIPGCSAFYAMKDFEAEHRSLAETVNVLDLLRCVYRGMGDRHSVSDPWLQKTATIPDAAAIARYKEQTKLFKDREEGHPSASKTVRQIFKEDEKVMQEVQRIRSENVNRESRTKVFGRLFDEASNRPGGLDRFEYLAEKDLERYTRERKVFKEVTQKKFDEEHGLVPVPRIPSP